MDTNNGEDSLLVELLGRISTKLNDKQLYLLVIHLISEDMWKRATICGLKENIQMKNENTLINKQNSNNRLLAFGLMTFNPHIQLSCDDNNINFDDLIRYCDEQ
ncbi:hypothetical protein RFI_33946, partial [Reticulomyxa filosa]